MLGSTVYFSLVMSLPTKATIVSRCGKARCLSFGNVQTPVVMIQTRTCFPPYLTLGLFPFVFLLYRYAQEASRKASLLDHRRRTV